MKKRITVACIFICSALTAFGQGKSIDERIGAAMNNSDWSELRELYSTEGHNLQTPYLHTLSKFFISQFYNLPDSAIAQGNVIMDKYQNELSASLPVIAYFMAEDYSRLGNNKTAFKIMHNLNEAYRQSGVEPNQNYVNIEDIYRVYSEQPAFSVTKPRHDTSASLFYRYYSDQQGKSHKNLYIGTQFNGKDMKVIFDTGAGINMITRVVAENVGARIIKTKGIQFNGFGIGKSEEIAFVDSIKLGDVTFRNVPFFIYDFKTNNEKVDEKLKEIDINCVIGNQMMMPLGEICFDFKNMQLTIPHTMSAEPAFAPNFFYSPEHLFMVQITDGLSGNRIKALLDSGASETNLKYHYYKNHENLFAGRVANDSINVGGLGGAHIGIKVLPTYWSYEIAGNEYKADSIYIEITSIQNNDSYDCLFGLQTMTCHNKMRLNFKDMWMRFE